MKWMQSWLRAEVQGEDEARHLRAHELGVPYVTFERHEVDPVALLLIPEPLSRAHQVVAYRTSERGVEVAMLDLAALEVLEPLRPHLPKILPRLAPQGAIKGALVRYQQVLKEKFGEALAEVRHPARLLRGLISHALAAGASAVHLEPEAGHLRVRYRIGGHLYDALTLPKEAHAALGNAVPASGTGTLELGFGEQSALRVTSAPTVFGKKLVIHPTRVSATVVGLEALGLHGEALERVHHTLARRRGVVVVSGFGKSTLVSSLGHALGGEHLSVAHPASAAELRAALKADSDVVVMDGGVDREAASLLTAAAARGVFVIVATNEVVSELEPTLVITCAVVRRLCTKQFHNTKKLSRSEGEVLEPHTTFAPVFNALKEEGRIGGESAWKEVTFAHPVPCSHCQGGYQGQVGVYEVADPRGVVGLTLVEDALFKAAEGTTSVEEVLEFVRDLG